jgi:hypothetical protein
VPGNCFSFPDLEIYHRADIFHSALYRVFGHGFDAVLSISLENNISQIDKHDVKNPSPLP